MFQKAFSKMKEVLHLQLKIKIHTLFKKKIKNTMNKEQSENINIIQRFGRIVWANFLHLIKKKHIFGRSSSD